MNYELFERALAEKKISRRKLAAIIGVNVNTFLSALGRKSDLDSETILKIAEALGVDYTELSLTKEQWQAYKQIEEDNKRRENDMRKRMEQESQDRLEHWRRNVAAENEEKRLHRAHELLRQMNEIGQQKGLEYLEDLAENTKYLKK